MLWRGRRFWRAGDRTAAGGGQIRRNHPRPRQTYHRSHAITRSAAALRVHTLQKISVTVGLTIAIRVRPARSTPSSMPHPPRRAGIRVRSIHCWPVRYPSTTTVWSCSPAPCPTSGRGSPFHAMTSEFSHPGEHAAARAAASARCAPRSPNRCRTGCRGRRNLIALPCCAWHPVRKVFQALPRRCQAWDPGEYPRRRHQRVRFTPDLMPATSRIARLRCRHRIHREGPVFPICCWPTRSTAPRRKTQAPLLEAMEEQQVSIDGRPVRCRKPFLVAATQNPSVRGHLSAARGTVGPLSCSKWYCRSRRATAGSTSWPGTPPVSIPGI